MKSKLIGYLQGPIYFILWMLPGAIYMRSSIGYLDTESWLDFTIGNGITWLVDMFVGMFIPLSIALFWGIILWIIHQVLAYLNNNKKFILYDDHDIANKYGDKLVIFGFLTVIDMTSINLFRPDSIYLIEEYFILIPLKLVQLWPEYGFEIPYR